MTNGVQTTPTMLSLSTPSIDLTNISVSFTNNWISCTFSRLVYDPSITGYSNLNTNYYILAAAGVYSGGSPQYHTSRQFSGSVANFSQISTANTTSTSTTTQYIKAHGFWPLC